MRWAERSRDSAAMGVPSPERPPDPPRESAGIGEKLPGWTAKLSSPEPCQETSKVNSPVKSCRFLAELCTDAN